MGVIVGMTRLYVVVKGIYGGLGQRGCEVLSLGSRVTSYGIMKFWSRMSS